MKACDKCGVELRETSVGYFMGVLIRAVEVETNAEHTPERCRDRLAARLAEAERGTAAMASGYESQITTLRTELAAYKRAKEENDERFMVERDQARAELAECRAELKREQIANAHDPVRQKLKAAEARAERLQAELRAARGAIAANCGAHYCRSCDAGTHNNWRHALHCGYVERLKRIDAAIAATATKTSEASDGVESGSAPSNAEPPPPGAGSEEPGTSSPDDAERAARKTGHDGVQWAWCEACSEARTKFIAWLQDYYGVGNESRVSMSTEDFKTVIRTRDAQAREAGRVEGWEQAVEACAELVERYEDCSAKFVSGHVRALKRGA